MSNGIQQEPKSKRGVRFTDSNGASERYERDSIWNDDPGCIELRMDHCLAALFAVDPELGLLCRRLSPDQLIEAAGALGQAARPCAAGNGNESAFS
jgi:hypothetical protein